MFDILNQDNFLFDLETMEKGPKTKNVKKNVKGKGAGNKRGNRKGGKRK